jgi:hypothetical protein
VSLKSLLTAARLIDLDPFLRSCEKQRVSDGKRTCTISSDLSRTTDLSSGRIASRKSSFLRYKHLFFSDSVLVSPPSPQIRSSAWEQEKHMAYVGEKEEDFREASRDEESVASTHRSPAVRFHRR